MAAAGANGWLNSTLRVQLNWSNLSVERERQLLAISQSSPDEHARQAALVDLWGSHSKLVIAIASRYRRPSIELTDLIGAGHLGLHAAIEKFDSERFEGRLASYAIGWIRWHIQDYIRRNAAPVRLPATAAHRQLARMAARLFSDARKSCQRERVDATEGELCERIGRRIGMDGDEVARSIHLINGDTVSLNAKVAATTGAARNLEDTLTAEETSPEDDVIFRLDHAKARRRIMTLVQEILGQREREVFLSRCMGDEETQHLETLAKRFGVTRERICQLEASAKRKIATALAQEGYSEFAGDIPITLPQTRARRRRNAQQSDRIAAVG